MRACIFAIVGIIALIQCSTMTAQEKSTFTNHQVSMDIGSYRNRYFYPMTNVQYSSPLFTKANLKFSARLRSYGTLFFYSTDAYDATPIVEYFFSSPVLGVSPISEAVRLSCSAGLGVDARIRLVRDIRSDAVSSVEPLLSVTLRGDSHKISFQTPLWTRLYDNGISFTVLPEVSYRIVEGCSLFLRYELGYLLPYQSTARDWRSDVFIGIHFLL